MSVYSSEDWIDVPFKASAAHHYLKEQPVPKLQTSSCLTLRFGGVRLGHYQITTHSVSRCNQTRCA